MYGRNLFATARHCRMQFKMACFQKTLKMCLTYACSHSNICLVADSGKTIWFLGQAVKTSPSHGENSGSIPLGTAKKTPDIRCLFYLIGNYAVIPIK